MRVIIYYVTKKRVIELVGRPSPYENRVTYQMSIEKSLLDKIRYHAKIQGKNANELIADILINNLPSDDLPQLPDYIKFANSAFQCEKCHEVMHYKHEALTHRCMNVFEDELKLTE